MNNKIKNYQNTKIKELIKEEDFLFIELYNGRKFLMNSKIVQEFSEYEKFVELLKTKENTFIVMIKDYQKHLIDFKTKRVIVSFSIYDNCHKICDTVFKIGNKLFNLKNEEYIPNTENLKPNTFCFLGKDLFLFDTTEENFLERTTIIVNEKGEQLLNCRKYLPSLIKDRLLLSDRDKEEIRILQYENGKFNLENETIIQKEQTEPRLYKEDICLVKNNTIYIIDVNLKEIKKYSLPVIGTITSETIENDTLLMTMKINDSYKVVGVNLINGNHFIAEKIGVRPLDMSGPATKITIARNNIVYDKHGIDICCNVTLLDENFNTLYELENVRNYDYIVCNKVDKIWLKKESGGILYNASLKKAIETPYYDIHFQFHDKTKIEYGFGLDEKTDKLQMIDEEGNILINSIPYEELGFQPSFGQFGFYYLNGYVCIIQHYNNTKRNTLLNNEGTIIYDKMNTIVNSIGKYFQIKEEEKTIYFDTITGEFNEKILNTLNDKPLLEEHSLFEITEEGDFILKHTLENKN